MKFVPLLAAMLLTLVCWGAQSPLMEQARHQLGSPWRVLFWMAASWAIVGVAASKIGLSQSGIEPVLLQTNGSINAILAGVLSCCGSAGVILAYRAATNLGSSVAAPWVSPAIMGLLPVFVVLASIVLLKRPVEGYGAYLSPGFILGILACIIGPSLVILNRPR